MYQTLLVETTDHICQITINRQEKMNALNRSVIEELGQVMDSIYNDANIWSALITGAGAKAFVAGADISEFQTLDKKSGEALARKGQDLVFSKIEHCPKPVVAAVNGFALGGGCELAMACHFRLASENAKFGQPEVNLGLIPGYGGTQRLVQLVGKGKAMELMMTGAMIDANEALRLGLVNYVTPADNLIGRCHELLGQVNSKAPKAIASVIVSVNNNFDKSKNGLEEEMKLFGECFDSNEVKEGASAFLEKRKPDFRS